MQSAKDLAGACSSAFELRGALDRQELPSTPEWPRLASPRPFGRRTRSGPQRNCNASFKSPVLSQRTCQSAVASKETLQREIEELKCQDLALDQEIAELLAEGYSLEELEEHIALLHEYNEIKDAGQMLLGRLAVIRGVTTKDLYPEFDLELND